MEATVLHPLAIIMKRTFSTFCKTRFALIIFITAGLCNGCAELGGLAFEFADLWHEIKYKSPFEYELYRRKDYSLVGVQTYRFDLSCDQAAFINVDPKLKDPYCRDLGLKVIELLERQFPDWEMREDEPNIRIIADLEAAWGWRTESYKIKMETVVYITVLRWETIMAQNRLKWFWNSKIPVRNVKMIYPDMSNDKAFQEALPNVAEAIVNFIADPESVDYYIEEKYEGY